MLDIAEPSPYALIALGVVLLIVGLNTRTAAHDDAIEQGYDPAVAQMTGCGPIVTAGMGIIMLALGVLGAIATW